MCVCVCIIYIQNIYELSFLLFMHSVTIYIFLYFKLWSNIQKVYSSVVLGTLTLLSAITTIHAQNSSSCQIETLSPLNINPSPTFSHSHGNNPSTFCLLKFDYSRNLIQVRSHSICLCDWFISLSIMSSGFIHVAACVRISCFLRKG